MITACVNSSDNHKNLKSLSLISLVYFEHNGDIILSKYETLTVSATQMNSFDNHKTSGKVYP